MGSKTEVWSAVVNFLVKIGHLLPYMGFGFLLGMAVVCVVSFVLGWKKKNFKPFKGYLLWTAMYGLIYFMFMVYLWWLALPDTPIAR